MRRPAPSNSRDGCTAVLITLMTGKRYAVLIAADIPCSGMSSGGVEMVCPGDMQVRALITRG
jgi:hypothetical protein